MNLKLKGKIIEKFGTQWKFAHSLGTHEHVVSQVIQGKRSLTVEDQKRWAEKLGDKEERLFPSN
jgi:plasmid maintenance system antidote protein VapI